MEKEGWFIVIVVLLIAIVATWMLAALGLF